MFKPISISERLLFCTVKIETSEGTGSGFFFTFQYGEHEVVILISNKHVITRNDFSNNYSTEDFKLLLHTNENNLTENEGCDFRSEWIFHETYDLAFTFFYPILTKFEKELGKKVFFSTLREEHIPKKEKLEEFSALEDVVMLGYPIGLSDKFNNLPIYRTGATATHPCVDFNGKKEAVADIACFPGSSGSPVFILNESSYGSKDGHFILSKKFFLLGVNYAGHFHSSEGRIIPKESPTKQEWISKSSQFINTSIYIKSSVILEFKNQIKGFI